MVTKKEEKIIHYLVLICIITLLTYNLYFCVRIIAKNIEYPQYIGLINIIRISFGIIAVSTISIFIKIKKNFNKLIPIFITLIYLLIITILKFNLMAIILCGVAFYFSIYYSYKILNKKWKKTNFWVLGTIAIMLYLFNSGIVFLDSAYGYNEIKRNIELTNINTSERTTTIMNCLSNESNKIFINSEMFCHFEGKFQESDIKSGFIKVVYTNKSIKQYNISENSNLKINITNNIRSFGFKLITELENEIYQSETGNLRYYFFTEEEIKERSQLFLQYTLNLLGIILFTVPIAMINFKNMMKSK